MADHETRTRAATAGFPASLFFSLSGLGTTSLAALLLNVFLARILSVQDFGHIRVARTVIDLLAIPATFGMGACIARHVADNRTTPERRAAIFATGAALALVSGLALSAIAFGALQVPGILQDAQAIGLLGWLVFILPFVALFGSVQGYLQGTGRMGRLATAQIGRSLILLIASVVLARKFGLNGWGAGRAISEAFTLALVVWVAADLRGFRLDLSLIRSFASFGGYAALTQGLTTLITTVDVLCLDRFRMGAEEIGHYGIATFALATVLLLPNAFSLAAFSSMAATSYDPRKTWDAAIRYTTILMGLVVPAAAILYLAAPLITVVFTPAFSPSVPMFRAMVPAFLISSLGNAAVNLVVSAGLMRQNLIAACATVAVNVALNLVMIPRFGVPGAIAATTASYAVRSALSFVILRMNLKNGSSEGALAQRRKRIVMVPPWYPNRHSAMYGIFNQKDARLLAERFDVSVIYVHFHGDAARGDEMEIERGEGPVTLRYYVYRQFQSPALFPVLYGYYFLKAYRRLVSESGPPDLLYIRNLLPCGIGALIVRFLYGVPYITRESDAGFPEHMRSRPKRLLTQWILRCARRNCAVSTYQRRVMDAIFPVTNIELVRNVIPPIEARDADPGDISQMARMLYAGNIVHVKGWDLLLAGLKLYLSRHDRPVHLTIVGGGDEESALRRKIEELRLTANVTALGAEPREVVLDLIAKHHFLVLPSRIDTCPNVVLEALAVGRPVLATRSGGAEDMIDENNGLLVDKESPEALCEGIHAMLIRYATFDSAIIQRRVRETNGLDVLTRYIESALMDEPPPAGHR